jgi:O-antigen ligase
MVYTSYSKAGWSALFLCVLLWFLLRRKWIWTVGVVLAACAVIFVQPFAEDFQKTFLNEIDYYVHGTTAQEEGVFRGRLQRWKSGMRDFNDMPLVNNLFGTRKLFSNPENYYIRALWDTGIAGFTALMALLGVTMFKILSRYYRTRDPVVLIGFLVFIFYTIYSMGSYPMFSPAFQWFTWGTIGFVLQHRQTGVSSNI